MRVHTLKMKQQKLHLKFRFEHIPSKERVLASEKSKQGLEAPEEVFVTLDAYEKKYGPADPTPTLCEKVAGGDTQRALGIGNSNSPLDYIYELRVPLKCIHPESID